MKKNFLISALAFCICVSSCSTDENMQSQSADNNVVFNELHNSLLNYNTSFLNENNIVQTRGFWGRLRGFLMADASGALFGSAFGGWGALFGGIFSSAVAGPVLAQEPLLVDSPMMDDRPIRTYIDTYVEPELNSISGINEYQVVTNSGIGYLHNTILSDINTKHPNIFSLQPSTKTMSELVAVEMKERNYSIPESEKQIIINKIESIIPAATASSTVDPATLLKSIYPELSNELSVINDFAANAEHLAKNISLLQEYLNGYLQGIENSGLTAEQKEALKASIEVAANSAVLWNVN